MPAPLSISIVVMVGMVVLTGVVIALDRHYLAQSVRCSPDRHYYYASRLLRTEVCLRLLVLLVPGSILAVGFFSGVWQ